MKMVFNESINWSNVSLKSKRKEAILKLKTTFAYSAYVLRADGSLEVYETTDKTKSGYTKKTLKENQYVLVRS